MCWILAQPSTWKNSPPGCAGLMSQRIDISHLPDQRASSPKHLRQFIQSRQCSLVRHANSERSDRQPPASGKFRPHLKATHSSLEIDRHLQHGIILLGCWKLSGSDIERLLPWAYADDIPALAALARPIADLHVVLSGRKRRVGTKRQRAGRCGSGDCRSGLAVNAADL